MGLASMTVVLGILVAQAATPDWSTLAFAGTLVGSVLLVLLGLLQTLGRRACFDRTRGELTLGWRGRRAPRPLASLKAVEAVEVGAQHQLNLVPDDPRQPRINLITDAAPALVRRAAERVASFLGVPLLDARTPTPAAARVGAGEEAVNPLEELSRSPLAPGKASIRGPARVVPKGDDILVLRARSRLTWIHLVPVLLTTGLELYIVWLAWFGPAAGQPGLGWPAMIVLLGGSLSQVAALKPLLLYRDHFDRQAGLLTLGWFGFKGTCPLAQILAVQLIPGGLVDKTAGPFGRGGERVSYQLNLVTADAYQDRLNLTDNADLKWTRQAGQQIAELLGVPVIDQIAEDD